MSERKRPGMSFTTGSSSLPRRAPSPSSAAFPSARSSNPGGPLGIYRPASREGSERSSIAPSDTVAARFGFASNTASSSVALKSVNGKRTLSGAGLRDPESPASSSSATKRPLLTSNSTTSVSPRFPPASSSYDASMLKNEYERREILSKQSYEKLQNGFKASGKEIERLKQEKTDLLRRWEEANAEQRQEKDTFEEQRKSLNERVTYLQQQNQELFSSLEEAQTKRSQLAQASHEEGTRQSLRITSLEFELAAANALAEEQKEMRSKIALTLERTEKEWEEDRQRMERKEREGQEGKSLTRELSELLTKIHKLEGENLGLQQDNRSLKTKVESIETLKEQKRSLEERLSLTDQLRRKYAEAVTKVEDLEAEKEEWNRMLSSGVEVLALEGVQSACANVNIEAPAIEAPNPVTPSNLPMYLSTLQGAISGLRVRSRLLEEKVASIQKQCSEAESTSEGEKSKRERLEEDLAVEKMERLKSVKVAEATRMELDSYVNLLDTFQEEARTQSSEYNAASAEHIQVLEGRLKTIEANLAASVREAQELRKLTQNSGGISREEREQLERKLEARERELLQSLDESREERAGLEKQCSELAKINDQLYLRVGRGEFDQSKERCLELSDNPVRQDRLVRTKTLNALRKENEELLHQVEELSKRVGRQDDHQENGGSGSAPSGMVPAQTLENQKREYEKLEQTMRNRDKAFDRLKEAFGAKAIEYVAAVKALFGYDMHVVSKGKVKLRSVYARTAKGTSLTFDSGEDGIAGNMKLVGEARQGVAVKNMQDYWLGNDRFSIPCFLAALQLELYEGTTRAIRPMWEAEEAEE
ncbi:hypothetical protein CBS101457_000690 [Exobasidium rhododendri]|nr:hypothetical protein CBS101457_000690 [Exobasidium rhododendri]